MKTRNYGRLGAALVLMTTASIAFAMSAQAHVTVSSTDAARGGYGLLTFRVPNESDSAATTKLTVQLPTDTPIATVRAEVKPGWTAEVERTTLDEPVQSGDFEITEAVTSVTWTATGDGIPVDAFDTFALSGGPFPDTESLTLPAIQEYADGEIAEWTEIAEGDEEPDRPAPTLTLADESSGHHGATSADSAAEADDQDDSRIDPISIAALALAVVALGLALKNRRRD